MRLYQITEVATRKAIPNTYFPDKKSAKDKRRELNGPLVDEREVLKYVVSPGPDHRHFQQ